MAGTQITGRQIADGTIGRVELITNISSQAVITRILEGNGISFSNSTGADSGTGDVTIGINASYLDTLYAGIGHSHTLGNLSNVSDDVDTTGSLTIGDLLKWSGSEWTAWTPDFVGGSGTTNNIPKFTSASILGNSNITDNGVIVNILSDFRVNGNSIVVGDLTVQHNGNVTIQLNNTLADAKTWEIRNTSTDGKLGFYNTTDGLYALKLLSNGKVESAYDISTTSDVYSNYFNSSADIDDGNSLDSFIVGGTSDNVFRKYSVSSVASFLGLGSNAYTSTAPTLQEVLTQGSATDISPNFQKGIFVTGNIEAPASYNGGSFDYYAGNTRIFSYGLNNSTLGGFQFAGLSANSSLYKYYLTISNNGDAAFDGNVTILGSNVLTEGNVSSITGTKSFYGSATIEGGGSASTLQAFSVSGNAAFMTFHRASNYAVNFGLDTDNQLKVGGFSMGNNKYTLWTEANLNPFRLNAQAPYTDGLNNTSIYNSVTLFDGYSDVVPNSPGESWWIGALTVGSASRGWQMIGGYNSDFHVRKGHDSGWQSWNRVWHSGNHRSDAQNDNAYVLKTGDTITGGSLTINDGGNALPNLKLVKTIGGHYNIEIGNTFTGGSTFGITTGIAGVSNGGFSIGDIDANLTRFSIEKTSGKTKIWYDLEVAGNIYSTGNKGFKNDVFYANVPNPIWSFGNAAAYGLAYYQGSALSFGDVIGFHFGNVASPLFSVSHTGVVAVNNIDPNFGGVANTKLSISQADGASGIVVGNATAPRFALNGQTDGSWVMYDYSGSTFTAGIHQKAGNIGIKTSASSSYAFQVNGAGVFGGPGYGQIGLFDDGTNANISNVSGDRNIQITATGRSVGIGYNTHFVFGNNSGIAKYNGAFGIKTTDPQYDLDVNGSIGLNGTLNLRSQAGGTNSPLINIREGANPTYGFTFTQDDITTGDLQLHRVNAGVLTKMITFERNTGYVLFENNILAPILYFNSSKYIYNNGDNYHVGTSYGEQVLFHSGNLRSNAQNDAVYVSKTGDTMSGELIVTATASTYIGITSISTGTGTGAGFNHQIAGLSSGHNRWITEIRPSDLAGGGAKSWYLLGANVDNSTSSIPIVAKTDGTVILGGLNGIGTLGNVGIRTSTPAYTLDVNGTARISSTFISQAIYDDGKLSVFSNDAGSSSQPHRFIILKNDTGEIANPDWGAMISGSARGGAIVMDCVGDHSIRIGTIDNDNYFTTGLMVRDGDNTVELLYTLIPNFANTSTIDIGNETSYFNNLHLGGSLKLFDSPVGEFAALYVSDSLWNFSEGNGAKVNNFLFNGTARTYEFQDKSGTVALVEDLGYVLGTQVFIDGVYSATLNNHVIIADARTANVSVLLPDPGTCLNKLFYLKLYSDSGGLYTATILTDGGQLEEGFGFPPTYYESNGGDSLMYIVVSNGTDYLLLSRS